MPAVASPLNSPSQITSAPNSIFDTLLPFDQRWLIESWSGHNPVLMIMISLSSHEGFYGMLIYRKRQPPLRRDRKIFCGITHRLKELQRRDLLIFFTQFPEKRWPHSQLTLPSNHYDLVPEAVLSKPHHILSWLQPFFQPTPIREWAPPSSTTQTPTDRYTPTPNYTHIHTHTTPPFLSPPDPPYTRSHSLSTHFSSFHWGCETLRWGTQILIGRGNCAIPPAFIHGYNGYVITVRSHSRRVMSSPTWLLQSLHRTSFIHSHFFPARSLLIHGFMLPNLVISLSRPGGRIIRNQSFVRWSLHLPKEPPLRPLIRAVPRFCVSML